MKRTIIRLLFIALAATFGAAMLVYLKFISSNPENSESVPATAVSEAGREPSDLPVLDFCELVNNPEKYDGKTVRFEAKLHIGLEGSWFSDARCGADNGAIVSAENPEVRQAIEKARARGKGEPWDVELNLVVAGKFKNAAYKDCCLIAPFQFEISKVEKASKVK